MLKGKLLAAASNPVTVPIGSPDAIAPHVGILMQNQTGGAGGNPVYGINKIVGVKGGSSVNFGLLTLMKNAVSGYVWDTWQPTLQSSGPSISIAAPLGLITDSPSTNIPSGDMGYDAGGGYMASAFGDLNAADLVRINGGNNAVVDLTSRTVASNISSVRIAPALTTSKSALMCLLADTTSIIVLLESGSFDSSAVGPTDLSRNISALALTDSLGVVIYSTSGNLIKYVTYNISGTTITIDSAASSGITAASGAKMCYIDSTHFLMVYKKAANILAARVVTVATGSVFALNTEYTVVANGITDDPIGEPGQFPTSDYAVSYINSSGQGCVALMSLSGTTITFNTPSVYHNANDVVASTDYYSSNFIGLSSTKGCIAYMVKTNFAGALTIARVIPVEKNSIIPTWASGWSGNIQITPAIGGGSIFDTVALGTDRIMRASSGTGGASITLQTMELDYSASLLGGNFVYAAAGSSNITQSLVDLGVTNPTSNVRRVLMTYGHDNTTVRSVVLAIAQDGTPSGNPETIVDSSCTWTSPFTVSSINYDIDKTLILNQRNDGIYASIVVTSGTTISSVTTPTKIYSAAITGISVYIGWCLLDPTHIALTFKINGIGASVDMAILSISGTSLSLGPVVSIGSAMTSQNGMVSVCQLTNGRGLIGYVDRVGGNANAWAQPYTWSGNTITLGSAVKITSSNDSLYTVQARSPLAALNGTEAFYAVAGTSKMFLLTSAAIGSVTSDAGTGLGAGQNVCLRQDCYDKFTVITMNSGLYSVNMAYRI